MLELYNLKRLTQELATEVHHEEHGKVWLMITMILEKLPLLALILDKDNKPIYQNEYTKKQYLKHHKKELSPELPMDSQIEGRVSDPLIFQKAINERKIQEDYFFSDASQINYKVIAIPLIYNGVAGAIVLMYDNSNCK